MSEDSKKSMQAAFTCATTSILAQGRKSIRTNGASCMYRHPDGLKCAIGHLLSDEQIEKYKIKEGQVPEQFPAALVAELLPGVDVFDAKTFLCHLQGCHDNASSSSFLENFIAASNALAKHSGLDPIKQ